MYACIYIAEHTYYLNFVFLLGRKEYRNNKIKR